MLLNGRLTRRLFWLTQPKPSREGLEPGRWHGPNDTKTNPDPRDYDCLRARRRSSMTARHFASPPSFGAVATKYRRARSSVRRSRRPSPASLR